MPAKKGTQPKNAKPGRPKGATNLITRSVKDALKAAFDDLQKVKGACLKDWAKNNPTEFYKIAAKLIPQEIVGDKENPITVIIRKFEDGP